MKMFIKLPMIAAGTGAGLFCVSLVVYYFNLDMRFMEVIYPVLEKWYDNIDRTPMPIPAEQGGRT